MFGDSEIPDIFSIRDYDWRTPEPLKEETHIYVDLLQRNFRCKIWMLWCEMESYIYPCAHRWYMILG